MKTFKRAMILGFLAFLSAILFLSFVEWTSPVIQLDLSTWTDYGRSMLVLYIVIITFWLSIFPGKYFWEE